MTPTMATVQTSTKVLLPKTPALTLLMIKLEETIPLYCQKLAFPTMESAASAAALLDNRITSTSISSPSNSVSSSPSSPRSVSVSQQALQSCWETYVSPFLLLAAAEALYAQERTPKLVALYVKISDDLIVVEQILCDPVASESGHYPKATSLAQQLLALRKWAAMRCRLLELILQGEPLPRVRSEFQELLDGIMSSMTDGDFMMQSLQTEVQLWSWLSEACWYLQDCRFMETILTVRRIKVKLDSISSKTKLHEWFGIALKEIHSILPLYFDRLKTHALPSYGFDPAKLGSPIMNADYDGQVLDFLRKNDSPIAVCIVFEDKAKDTWSAMYLRSSLDSLTRSSTSAGSLSTRLLLGRRDEEVDDVQMQDPYKNTQEWPHTEWDDLTTVLRNEVNPEELGPAMTFRAKGVDESPPTTASTAPDFLARAPAAPESYFHVASLSSTSCLWLVAIVKDDDAAADSGRWNLRIPRGGNNYTEEDIRAFVDHMASKLRVSNLVYKTTFEQEVRETIVNSSTGQPPIDLKSKKTLSAEDLVSEWTEQKTQECLRTIKSHFGLRPQSPMVEPLKSPYQLQFPAFGNQRKLRGRKRRSKHVDESAAAWFLGPELLKLLKEERLMR